MEGKYEEQEKKLEEIMAKYEAYFLSHYSSPYGPLWDFHLHLPPPTTRACNWFVYTFVIDFYIIRKLFFNLIDFYRYF